LESKASALATPSYLRQSRPNLKVWTPTRLNFTRWRENEIKSTLESKSSDLDYQI